jgi:hypothetical protein
MHFLELAIEGFLDVAFEGEHAACVVPRTAHHTPKRGTLKK